MYYIGFRIGGWDPSCGPPLRTVLTTLAENLQRDVEDNRHLGYCYIQVAIALRHTSCLCMHKHKSQGKVYKCIEIEDKGSSHPDQPYYMLSRVGRGKPVVFTLL